MLAHRSAGPDDGPAALLVHGFPETSHMWLGVMDALAARGIRSLAPDLPGYGDSPFAAMDGAPLWRRFVDELEEWRRAAGLERAALVGHDWGGMIGCRWATEHPEAVSALVLTDTGFFTDGRWHGMAEVMRTPGQGEELVAGLAPESLGALLKSVSPGMSDAALAEYGRFLATEQGKQAVLDFYRTCEFTELADGPIGLGDIGVPALILWGEDDQFAPVSGAYRFKKMIPDAEMVILPGVGHFAIDDAPEASAHAIADFLGRVLL